MSQCSLAPQAEGEEEDELVTWDDLMTWACLWKETIEVVLEQSV